MTYLQAIILGIIQGLTEFFPVSSSTHLKVAKMMMGVEENQVIFDLFCHFGTLAVLVYFFRKDIAALFTTEKRKLVWFFVAMLPLIPCYFLLKPLRQHAPGYFLGVSLIVTSLILFIGNRLRLRQAKRNKDVLWIGTMQAMALIPGISRSASTISTARVLGWEAADAVRFSFLLSIPTILGGTAVELAKSASHPSFSLGPCLMGFAASLGMGILVIPRAIRYLEKGKLKPFAWYCLLAGSVITLLLV